MLTGASRRAVDGLDTSRIWGLIRKPFDIDDLISSAIECSNGKPRRRIA